MILAPSLIPRPRVIHHARIRRIRGWAGVIVLTGLLGVAGSIAGRSWVAGSGWPSAQSVLAAEQKLRDLTNKRDALNARAASQAATLRAATAISSHADWSILLAYIAKLGAERISLDRFSLRPVPAARDTENTGNATDTVSTGGADEAGGYDVHIEGRGRSQQDIAAFVLGLDRSGVFASTRLEKSGGTATGDGVPFSILCRIRPANTRPQKPRPEEDAG